MIPTRRLVPQVQARGRGTPRVSAAEDAVCTEGSTSKTRRVRTDPARIPGRARTVHRHAAGEQATYLFETNRRDRYTTRWIRQIVKRYALEAGVEKRICPHLFRHQLLTYLTQRGIVDAKIQLLSGHQGSPEPRHLPGHEP